MDGHAAHSMCSLNVMVFQHEKTMEWIWWVDQKIVYTVNLLGIEWEIVEKVMNNAILRQDCPKWRTTQNGPRCLDLIQPNVAGSPMVILPPVAFFPARTWSNCVDDIHIKTNILQYYITFKNYIKSKDIASYYNYIQTRSDHLMTFGIHPSTHATWSAPCEKGSLLGSLPMAERTAKGSVSWSSFCSNPSTSRPVDLAAALCVKFMRGSDKKMQCFCKNTSPWYRSRSWNDITNWRYTWCHCYTHYIRKWHESIRSQHKS